MNYTQDYSPSVQSKQIKPFLDNETSSEGLFNQPPKPVSEVYQQISHNENLSNEIEALKMEQQFLKQTMERDAQQYQDKIE